MATAPERMQRESECGLLPQAPRETQALRTTQRPMRHLLAVCTCALVAACSSSEAARFGDTHDLVVAEVLESNPLGRPFPFSFAAEWRERHPAHYFAAFIVDTTGLVEERSISFIGAAPEIFRRARCAELMSFQFRRVRRAGVPRRALMIRPFDFTPASPTPSLPTAGMLFDSTRAAVFGHGVDAAVEQLRSRPHC